jgi:hypothetical protein
MIKSKWDIFKAKFSENPQNNFDGLLFVILQEFHKPENFPLQNQAAMKPRY